MHLDTVTAQREADPPRADRELERSAIPGQRGEKLARGLDRGRLVHRVQRVVVGRRNRGVEMAVVVHRPMLGQTRRPPAEASGLHEYGNAVSDQPTGVATGAVSTTSSDGDPVVGTEASIP